MEILEQIWQAIRTATLPDLGLWSYLVLFLLVFLEGPVATMTAGAMAGAGILRFDLVMATALAANIMADYTWYLLGFFGGNRAVLYRFRWMRKRRKAIRRLQSEVRQSAVRLFLLTKVSVGVMSIPVLVAAGVARVPWYRLFVVSLIVEPIWNGLLIAAGYRLGDYITALDRGVRYVALFGSAIVIWLLVVAYRQMLKRIASIDELIE
jgi:membrane protein DedA with SNARE-associated domain